eukprot:1382989-Rhodomonas_salina.1
MPIAPYATSVLHLGVGRWQHTLCPSIGHTGHSTGHYSSMRYRSTGNGIGHCSSMRYSSTGYGIGQYRAWHRTL